MDGGAGRDLIIGGAGADVLVAGGDNDNVQGGDGDDELHGQDGDDYMDAGAGRDVLLGGAGADVLVGGADNDGLHGQDGNDELNGGDGDDYMDGGAGNDTMYGGNGNDIIIGGAGADILFGQDGADTFVFGSVADSSAAAMDRIVDFNSAAGDRIDLSAIDADSTTAAKDGFTFIGTGGFTNKAGQLRYEMINGQAQVSADVNGDGVADMAFTVNTGSLSAGDFVGLSASMSAMGDKVATSGAEDMLASNGDSLHGIQLFAQEALPLEISSPPIEPIADYDWHDTFTDPAIFNLPSHDYVM
jgi:Ca2+-binding RTX toxin-like protein